MKHLEIFTGRVGVIEELREFDKGCVLNFSVAETPRIKKGDEWTDGPTIWTKVTVFGDEARNVLKSIKPGTVVTVFGERKANDYIVKDTNEKRTHQSVIAEQVSIAITRWNFVNEMGSINYAKGEAPTLYPASGGNTQSKPANSTSPANSAPPVNSAPKVAKDDPFANDDSADLFGDDDDPFGLNS